MNDEPSSGEQVPEWPTCPECDQRRLTVCPFCQTSGSKFPAADHHYLVDADAFDDTRLQGATAGKQTEERETEEKETESPMQRIVLCDICDEPFLPKYYNRCEWCGHEFGDGIEGGPTLSKPVGWASRRELIVILALLFAGGLAAIYFSYVFAR